MGRQLVPDSDKYQNGSAHEFKSMSPFFQLALGFGRVSYPWYR